MQLPCRLRGVVTVPAPPPHVFPGESSAAALRFAPFSLLFSKTSALVKSDGATRFLALRRVWFSNEPSTNFVSYFKAARFARQGMRYLSRTELYSGAGFAHARRKRLPSYS